MTNDNPKSKIDNPKSIDPTLSDHLTELAELARENGAAEVFVLRGPRHARLVFNFGGQPEYLLLEDREAFDPPGVLVVLRFPASDGGEAGVEVK